MSEDLSIFLYGSFCLAVGALILQNLDGLVRFDQQSGAKLKAWLKKHVSNPTLNRELWSVGTPSGRRSSRIVFRVAGVILILLGAALVGLSFRGRFQ
jgi:hypothetical protein